MIVRVAVAAFASMVCGLSFLVGLTRLMSSLLIGFGAFGSFFFGVFFLLPVNSDRLLFPVHEPAPAWPYLAMGVLLVAGVGALYYRKPAAIPGEAIGAVHFKFLLGGIAGYLCGLFLPSFYWFPSDAARLTTAADTLAWKALMGTGFYLVAISISCYCFYRASKGATEAKPDLMRRFVLALFAFFQFDKVPLLVSYLLIYAPDREVIFPNMGALALVSYVPVAMFLVKVTWESADQQ